MPSKEVFRGDVYEYSIRCEDAAVVGAAIWTKSAEPSWRRCSPSSARGGRSSLLEGLQWYTSGLSVPRSSLHQEADRDFANARRKAFLRRVVAFLRRGPRSDELRVSVPLFRQFLDGVLRRLHTSRSRK